MTFRTCGLDNTCVLCSYCFNEEDHIGHQVIITISQRDSGGVCDCGDPEAWINQFSCKYHHPVSPADHKDDLPEEFKNAITQTVGIALDYVIDVLSYSDVTLQRFSTPQEVWENERVSRLSQQIYGSPDLEGDGKYVLSVWNDQRHSSEEVVDLITLHLKKVKKFGEMVTQIVDSYGRGTLEISDKITEMLQHKQLMEKSGLVYTIRSTRDHFREEMCDTIIHWIEDIAEANVAGNYLAVNELLCQALTETWNVGTAAGLGELDPSSPLTKHVNTSLDGYRIPAPGSYPPQPFVTDQGSPYDASSPPLKCDNVPEHWLKDGPDPPNFNSPHGIGVRVQYLIYFDIRLWKSLRNTLKDLYISVLVASPGYKAKLGHCYSQLYPMIAEMYVLDDREPECSIVNTLSTQLFTTPSVATDLTHYNYFSMHMAGLFNFFTKGRVGPVSYVDVNAIIHDHSKSLNNRRFGQLIHDFEYILNRNTDKASVTGNINRIKQVCDFLMLFQGVLPIIREKKNHVEFESDAWIRYFNCIPSVLQLANMIAVGINQIEIDQRHSAIRTVFEAIYKWGMGFVNTTSEITGLPQFKTVSYNGGPKQYKVIDFDVANSKISLHHPLNVFLSCLIQYGKLESKDELKYLLQCDPSNLGVVDDEEAVMIVFDYHMRVLVLLSQIKIGLWVRNGVSVRNQMNYYRDITLRDPAYSRDIFMIQTSLVIQNPSDAFIRLIERWGLLNHDENTVYEDEQQKLYVFEDLIHYLIVFITERRQLLGLSAKESKKKYITKEIIQCLAFKSMTFSEICTVVPDLLTTDEMFEVILSDLTTFKSPTGVRDSGMYNLKPEYMSQFDTRYIHFHNSKMNEAEAILKTFYHKTTGKPLDSIVVDPYLEQITSGPFVQIGAFTRTFEFFTFVLNTLKYISANEEREPVLNLLLSLLHVAALDDLNVQSVNDQTFARLFCTEIEIGMGIRSSVGHELLDLVKNPNYRSSSAVVGRIFQIVFEKDPTVLGEFFLMAEGKPIQESFVFNNNKDDLDTNSITSVASAAQKKSESKKKFAKKKQKKIMANLQKQQKLFAAKNKETMSADLDNDKDKMEDDEDDVEAPQCILCKMPCDSKKLYGMLGYVQKSNATRSVPFDDENWVMEAYGFDRDLDKAAPETDDRLGYGNDDSGLFGPSASEEWKTYRREFRKQHVIGPGFPQSAVKMSTVVSSCSHTLHYTCYTNHMKNLMNRGNQLTRNNPDDPTKNECLCPLCRSMNNVFIPIVWKPNNRSFPHELRGGDIDIFTRFRAGLSEVKLSVDHLFEMRNSKELVRALKNGSFWSLLRAIDSDVHGDNLENVDVNMQVSLFDSLASTLSDLELSLRGIDGFLLENIPSLSLSLIRTFTQYTMMVAGHSNYNFKSQLVPGFMKSTAPTPTPFTSLIETSLSFGPFLNLGIAPFIHHFFKGEILNVLCALVSEISKQAKWARTDGMLFQMPGIDSMPDNSVAAFGDLILGVKGALDLPDGAQDFWQHPKAPHILYTMLRKSITPYLRRACIFVYAHAAKDYSAPVPNLELHEAERLCDFLQIPRLDQVLADFVNSQDMASNWLAQAKNWPEWRITYPNVQMLLHLSPRLDQFFTLPNQEPLHAEPAICLFCGDVVKVQLRASPSSSSGTAFSSRQKSPLTSWGSCNEHRLGCGKTLAIFLLPKRTSLLFLNGHQGSFMPAPYLDLHGESEDTLSMGCRRARPQYLNRRRYENLVRSLWLGHGIGDYIGRKLYATMDVGGWDTL